MSNLATLQPAPLFTAENAAEMGRRSGEAKRLRKQHQISESDLDKPRIRAIAQINRVLHWMERTSNKDEYFKLSIVLDRLWNKAFPTQAAVRSRPQRRSLDSLGASPTPQPVVVEPVKPSSGSVSG